MRNTHNKKKHESMYKPMMNEINPVYIDWLQSELDKSLATIKRMREDYQTLEARFRTATQHWGEGPSKVIANRENLIKQLKEDNISLRLELKRLTEHRMPSKAWSQMKQADTELLPLGKANQL